MIDVKDLLDDVADAATRDARLDGLAVRALTAGTERPGPSAGPASSAAWPRSPRR